MTRHVVIIGAGLAGLAAAEQALLAGAEVTVLDQADAPGGQYHRTLPEEYEAGTRHGHADFSRQRRVLEHPRCRWWPNSTVWALERRDADNIAADRLGVDQTGHASGGGLGVDRSGGDRTEVGGLGADQADRGRAGVGGLGAGEPGAGHAGVGGQGADPVVPGRAGVDRLGADHFEGDSPGAGRPPLVHVLRGDADGSARERHVLTPDALIIATGAHDRTLPFPGWQLPGVFTAGAAQALAKGEGVAVGRRVLVAGSGPFLLPVAESLLGVGADVVAVLEANNIATVRKGWSRQPWRLIRHVGKAGELIRYAGTLARHRVSYRMGRTVVEAKGEGRVREVVTARVNPDWSVINGTERTYQVDAVCVGHGFVPQLELAVAAGCDLDGGFVRVDRDQRTTARGVFAAGEVTGIGGAVAAAAEGAVAGRVAAGGVADQKLRRARDQSGEFAQRLAQGHPIGNAWAGWLRPDTVVCRCEETTVAELREAAGDPVQAGPHALKLGTRAGLGPCQGRMCGPAVAELCGGTAAHHRPIAQPIRLGELAQKETHEHP
ncbi:FAD/NAD(P)-binding oxidoreductase [Amycolatopsis sp., V23-08]|uniref:FAD/NAD(P)-binding oxidoreductase n=1 Tax=Amycolatopsis heterodermiae TaxID=3110235 RepID=A0ABU5RBE3_9PSEU|nr:FAD/NAD(P)-binding oxidoreductase [Amycolatopsis sp., V23-08]MEA5363089.1 FAD/NAD(P)-binding oxidoreductase [Amycolatopsis sp., V23-08]